MHKLAVSKNHSFLASFPYNPILLLCEKKEPRERHLGLPRALNPVLLLCKKKNSRGNVTAQSIVLAQHCIQNNHDFDLDDVKIIDRCFQGSKRLFLEAWHSIGESNAINEHIYIPDIYKALGNQK